MDVPAPPTAREGAGTGREGQGKRAKEGEGEGEGSPIGGEEGVSVLGPEWVSCWSKEGFIERWGWGIICQGKTSRCRKPFRPVTLLANWPSGNSSPAG